MFTEQDECKCDDDVEEKESFDIYTVRDEWASTPHPRNLTKFLNGLRERLEDPEEVDRVQECEDCSDLMLEDDAYTVSGRQVCEDCISSYYTCDSCEEYVHGDDIHSTLEDSSVCDSCLENHYSWCEDCDGYYNDNYADEHSHGCDCEAPRQHFYVRNDGEPPLENDTRVQVTLPSGVISQEGLTQIARLIQRNAPKRTAAYPLDSTEDFYESDYYKQGREADNWFMLASRLDEIGPEWQKRDGNFTKRLSRFAYKEYGIKLSSDLMSEVGNIGSAHSVAVDFAIEVTRNLNLSAEEFGHEDSCWWQSYFESRCALKSNGGFGLRTFSDGDRGWVTGRAWVMPLRAKGDSFEPTLDTMTPDAFVVFNGYGQLSGYAATRIVAHMAGMTYRKINFSCSPMYVNGDMGYLVAPEDVADGYTDGSLYLNLDAHAVLVDDTPAKELAHV